MTVITHIHVGSGWLELWQSEVWPLLLAYYSYDSVKAISWKWMNRFQCILAQVVPGLGREWSTSGIRRSRLQEAEVWFGGLAESARDIIFDPSSRVDRGIQSAMEMLPMKRGGGWGCCTVLTAPSPHDSYVSCWCTYFMNGNLPMPSH